LANGTASDKLNPPPLDEPRKFAAPHAERATVAAAINNSPVFHFLPPDLRGMRLLHRA
jgi:hypothetical protein